MRDRIFQSQTGAVRNQLPEKWKSVRLGEHSFFTVSTEAELISDTVSEAVRVICQSFLSNYLSAKFHHSALSVPKSCHLVISFFTRDILLNNTCFFQLKFDFFACVAFCSSHVIDPAKIKQLAKSQSVNETITSKKFLFVHSEYCYLLKVPLFNWS